MPRPLHDALERSATKKGLVGDRRNAYVFGSLRKAKMKGKKKGRTMDDAALALSSRLKKGKSNAY
jgi:hypothetical protein